MMIIIFIIIVIIIILLLLILTNRPKINNTLNDKTTYKYSDLREKFKTGDIILFSYKKHKNNFHRMQYYLRTSFLGFEYGHAGLIMKHNGKLYVVECTDKDHSGYEKCPFMGDKCTYMNDKKEGGVRIIEMDTLLERYYRENEGHFGIKFISKEIPSTQILNSLVKYHDVVFENKYRLMTLALIDIFISSDISEAYVRHFANNNTMMCTEFLHRMLYEPGVLKEYPSKLFWPHKINDDDFKKLENIEFSKIHRFII